MVMGRLLLLLPNFEWMWSLEFTHNVIISSKKERENLTLHMYWSSFFSFGMKERELQRAVCSCEDGVFSESFTSFEGNPP